MYLLVNVLEQTEYLVAILEEYANIGIKGFDTNDYIGVHLSCRNKNSGILNSGF